uniref:CCDC151 n=1 Tax=Schmidtea mediterranea TaxID=79327 RepID=A0A076Q0C2_SCHMD|nr:CCDC151 [Schmidtea mediterranea]
MPKPGALQRQVVEEIDEIKAKLALLEGDRKAYFESSRQALDDCKKRVTELRRDNNKLRLQLSDRLSADDHVINQAFQNKPTERAMLANKTTPVAIQTMDYKVSDGSKKLNALKHVTASKQKRLDELQYQYNELARDTAEAQATLEGANKEGQRLRDLENRLDKALLKCNEAEHIKNTYGQIKAKLEDEHLNYGNNLDAMEAEIKRCREEVIELKIMHQDANLAKTAALEELSRQESLVFAERRRRDVELQNMKQVAQEKQLMQEKVEKRIAARESTSNAEDERTSAIGITEEQQKKITDFEEAFKIIKEATGVSDLDEVVLRFENQGETKHHLVDLKIEAQKMITKLREEKDRMQLCYAEMKYTGETKMSNGQKLLEEYKQKVDEEEHRRITVKDDLERSNKVLIQCKSGIEHLHDKLKHIKVSKSTAPQAQIDVSSDEFVLDILSRCEERLLQLLEHLGQVDIEAQLSKMQEEEFQNQIEHKIPLHNVRVKLPQVQKDNVYEDEEDSGDDDADILTRNVIKKQSQQLVDMKTKKRNPKKKKKTKTK